MARLTTTADDDGSASALAPADLLEGTYAVRARQKIQSAWSIWTDPQYVTVLPPVRRFEPAYWHINMPMSISAALTTTGPDGVRLDAVLRRKNDLVGLKWSSRDDLSHPQLGYLESRNYVGTVWDLGFRITGLPGLDTGAEIEDVPGIVMTVTDDEGLDYYIRLVNYLTSGTAQAGTLYLDFAGGPVFGGYNIADAEQRVTVPWDRIVEFSIGLAPPDYDPEDDTPLAAPLTISLELTDMVVSGSSAMLPRRSPGQTIPTLLRMTDGYDDSYSLTPQRVVDGLVHLGYSGPYVIYIGASHLHDLVWDAAAGTFQVDPAHPVAMPVRRWFADLFARLLAAGFTPIISQSYEVYAEFCPASWQQRDSAGNGARTGWEPPSTLIAPTVPQAMGYLRDVALTICGLLQDAGGDIHYQVGEPWWWDGSYTGGSPCIYDPATQEAYVAETGNAVPTPHLASIMQPVGIHGPYLDWLSGKLGASTLWLRDQVKAAHPGMTSYVLFFTPQVLSPVSEVVTRLNLPIESWRYPAFDICQIEDYDWVVEGDWDNVARTLGAATDTLGYPLNRIDYFSGFNLLPETASEVWPHITRAAEDAFGWGIRHVYVWARPQVWRDGWVYPSGRLVARPGLSPDPGLPFVPPVFPVSLLARRNSFGDVRLSFDPREAPAGHTYRVDVMDVTGEQVVRTLTVTSPALVDGRVVVDYPIELNADDFGFPPTWLVWRVRVDGQAPVGKSGPLPVDNSFVRRALGFAGQSNALGHFTTLSGATMAHSSAATFRRAVAERLGLSSVEVIPVQMAWGSSAADRGGDDDPVSGTNYWWDLDADAPGPRLTETLGIMADLGIPLSGIVWAQGENDASAMNPLSAPRHSTPARYKLATEKVFAALRTASGNPALPIWIQVMGRGWWGDAPNPPEAGGQYYKAARDVQIQIAADQSATYIGSWTPGAETIAGYVPEVGNPGWVHYTAGVYHAVALELAEAIATPLDRAGARPEWTLMTPPDLAVAVIGYDVHVSWPAGAGAVYEVANLHVVDGTTISTTTVPAGSGQASWSFTGLDQRRVYGYAGGWVNLIVRQIMGAVYGPSVQIAFDPAALPGAPAVPAGLTVEIVSGYDVRLSWDAQAGDTFRLRNLNVVDNSLINEVQIIAEGDRASWAYTGLAQIAANGYPGGWMQVEVARMYGVMPGPVASYAGDINALPGAPVAPTGLVVSADGVDIVLRWAATPGAVYEVVNYNAVTGAVLPVVSLTATGATAEWRWPAAAQISLYGELATWLYVVARQVWGVVPGPVSAPVNMATADIPGWPVTPSGLVAGYASAGGWDIEVTWPAAAGKTWRVISRNVETGAQISSTTVTSGKWTFTAAQQVAAYGYNVAHVDVEVAQMVAGQAGPSTRLVLHARAALALDGTQPELWADFVRGQYLLGGNTATADMLFGRSGGPKWVVDPAGTLVEVPANTLAFDYSSGRRRMVLEGAATNLLLQSQAFAANWGVTRCTRTDGVADPAGGTNASTLVVSDASNSPYFEQTLVTVSVGDVCTLSLFVKAGTSSGFSLYGWEIPTAGDGNVSHVASFSWTGGVPVLAAQTNLQGVGVHPVGGGWFRVWITHSITKAGRLFFRVHPSNVNVVGNSLSIYLPQLEKGVAATSPIPTTTAAVTRVADTCALTPAAVGIVSSSGPNTLAWRGSVVAAVPVTSLIRAADAPFIRAGSTGFERNLTVVPAGSALTMGVSVMPGELGCAVGWNAARTDGAINGGAIAGVASAVVRDFSTLRLDPTTATSRLEIDELVVWPIKGSNAAIQAQARVWA